MSQPPSVYDMPHPKLPRAAGNALRLLAALVESAITGPLLVPTLLKNAGVPILRRLRLDEPPTYMPFHDFTPSAKKPVPINLEKLPRLRRKRRAEFAFHSIRDYAEAYRSGRVTPRQVAERALEAIAASEQLDPPLRAFTQYDSDRVLAQADASAKRLKARRPLSLFDGVPLAVKEEMDVAGFGTTVGTRIFGHTPAAQDATVVARLRAAGAIILGKANMAEYGLATTGLNIPWGTARNPHNPAYHSGGSSSGPAAAVAAGLGPVAVAVDGGGSIRIPASFCGLVGLMSTTGRMSGAGSAPIARTVDHLGPVAANAEDAALFYAVSAGFDPRDPDTMHQPPVALDQLDRARLSDLTLGIFPEWFDDADPEVAAICHAMVESLRKMGARIQVIAIPELGAAYVAHGLTILSEQLGALAGYPDSAWRELSLEIRLQFMLVKHITPADFVQAQRVRTRTMSHFREAFAQVDAILTPSVAIPVPRIAPDALEIGESNLTQVIATLRFASQANLCGLPAISFPAGYDSAGLPVGFQAIGRPWSEATLLRLAYAADALVERRRPQVYYDLLSPTS
jgi:Asp-tRNA(Asn)/Glu-tRNA(Gln) amidotransferase A subunit family amidase